MDVSAWLPVIGYTGIYEVSDTGMVRSIDRTIQLSNGRLRKIKGKLISPKHNEDGYLFVSLSKDGIVKTKYTHRLVAQAFIPNPGILPEVNHLSGNKTDNTVENLQWCTHQQNVVHAYVTGLSNNIGASHRCAVGVIDNTLEKEYGTVKEWCDARGINYSTGRNILNGSNKSRTIDLTGVVRIPKSLDNV